MTDELLSTIRHRHAAAQAKVNRLSAQLEAAQKEANDLATTLRVLEGIGEVRSVDRAPQTVAKETSQEGLPSIPDLILASLAEGPKHVSDLVEDVVRRSPKEIDVNNIRSSAWRMWKRNRIARDEDQYSLAPGSLDEALAELLGSPSRAGRMSSGEA